METATRDGQRDVDYRNGRDAERETRAALDRSASGAPAAGKAVRSILSTDEIFQRLVATADEEFSRSTRLLFLSGLAAGFAMTVSFVGSAALTAQTGSPALGDLLYPLGFLIVVVGRYQLFTENTLTPVTLVLTRIASLPLLLKVWGVVLLANVLGAGLMAYLLANTGIFAPEVAETALRIGEHAVGLSFGALFWKGVLAGGLVAGMVWLNHAVRSGTARVLVVFAMIYPVAAADLAHSIVGASEVLYVVFEGAAGAGAFLWGFFAPAVLGNTVGGVGLVAVLNYAQTRDQRFVDRDCGQLELTWREWLLGRYAGQPAFATDGASGRLAPEEGERLRPPVSERDHATGPADAPVTLVQYGDFECPTSRRIAQAVQRLMQHRSGDGAGDVRYVWRHLPMSRRHPHAQRAAMASEDAAEQGRFWEMHEQLLSRQDRLEEDDLVRYAREIGLDTGRFEDDLDAGRHRERVLADRRHGIQSGVRRTANLFIDGARYPGDFTPDAIEQALEEVLKAQRRRQESERPAGG